MKKNELNILDVLYKCQVITKKSTFKVGSNQNVLIDLAELELIEKVKYKYSKNSKNVALYVFTEKGLNKYSEIVNKSKPYLNSNLGLSLKLSYIYSNLSVAERETWKTKNEIMDEMNFPDAPDAMYEKEGKLVAISFIDKREVKRKVLLDKIAKILNISSYKIIWYRKE